MGALKDSRKRRRGNVATSFAIAALPLAGVVAAGVDLVSASRERALLQAAADAGALAGAGEVNVSTRGDEGIARTAVDHASAAAGFDTARGAEVFQAVVERSEGAVTVRGVMARRSIFGDLAPAAATISVESTAETVSTTPLCVLQTGSTTRSTRGLTLVDDAVIRAPGCLVQSNDSILVQNGARIEASAVRAVGTATGTIMPFGAGGALPVPDPFATMNLRPPTPCRGDEPDVRVSGYDVLRLDPGVHCGEFRIGGAATLELKPGDHYFMDEIEFRGSGRLRGEDVVLIFDSDDEFDFGERAEVSLSGRRSGPFAGFLIITGRDNRETFTIASDRVRQLLGTIYIPSAELLVSTTGSVAQDSAWSVIVAKRLTLRDKPILVINKNYGASNVPVPNGVGPGDGAPRLSR